MDQKMLCRCCGHPHHGDREDCLRTPVGGGWGLCYCFGCNCPQCEPIEVVDGFAVAEIRKAGEIDQMT